MILLVIIVVISICIVLKLLLKLKEKFVREICHEPFGPFEYDDALYELVTLYHTGNCIAEKPATYGQVSCWAMYTKLNEKTLQVHESCPKLETLLEYLNEDDIYCVHPYAGIQWYFTSSDLTKLRNSRGKIFFCVHDPKMSSIYDDLVHRISLESKEVIYYRPPEDPMTYENGEEKELPVVYNFSPEWRELSVDLLERTSRKRDENYFLFITR